MFYATLNAIRANSPEPAYLDNLLAYLGKTEADDEQVSFKDILDATGLDGAIWALRCVGAPEVRLFAVRCARRVQHLITDKGALDALDIAERYVAGDATRADLSTASIAVNEATWRESLTAAECCALESVSHAVSDPADESVWWKGFDDFVLKAARSAADSLAWEAMGDVELTMELCLSEGAARQANEAAWNAAREAQKEDFIATFCGEDDR